MTMTWEDLHNIAMILKYVQENGPVTEEELIKTFVKPSQVRKSLKFRRKR